MPQITAAPRRTEPMAILHPNTLIGSLQGTLGDLVLVRTRDGRIIVRHRPVGTDHSTPAEQKAQAALRRANAYVQQVKADPQAYARYQTAARLRGKRACDLARADYAHAPVIQDVDLSGYTGHAAET